MGKDSKKYRNKVSVIVKTFLRDDYMYKCVLSLLEHYPDFNIIIVDDGYKTDEKTLFYNSLRDKHKTVTIIEVDEFDIGLCRGRNMAVKEAKTPYVLIGDDDFLYTPEAKLYKMVDFLEKNKEIDLLSGSIRENDKIRHYEGFFDLSPGHFTFNALSLDDVNSWKKSCGLKYSECDLAFNFFVARTDKVEKVLWDEKIKVAYEHADFFIGMKKAGHKVAYTPDCVVIHKPVLGRISKKEFKEYPLFRNRKTDRIRFFTKHKLNAMTDMQGRTDYFEVEQPDEGIDYIIKTGHRRQSLENLLFSIVEFNKKAKIYIADDEKRFDAVYYKDLWERLFAKGLTVKPTAFNCPHDAGLSYCRNFLIDSTKSPYIFLLDDDFVFTKDTDPMKMVKILEANPSVGVVGGMLFNDGENEMHFEGSISQVGTDIIYGYDPKYWQKTDDIKWRLTECVLNFGVFRREVFSDLKWDTELKISGEHTDFYLRFKNTKWQVAYCPEVTALHIQDLTNKEYKQLRSRKDFLKILFTKHNADRLIYHNGLVYHFYSDTGEIETYRINKEEYDKKLK